MPSVFYKGVGDTIGELGKRQGLNVKARGRKDVYGKSVGVIRQACCEYELSSNQ